MNSRMSRLRRSLSRSVHQLGSLSRTGSLSGLVQLPTSVSGNATLCDKFATSANFSQLKQIISANNEALKEVINVFEEKAALDFQYSKALQKLSARLHKVAHQMESEIDKGWTAVAEQFDVHSTLHSNLGSAMTDDVVQPLRAIQVSQQKTIRAAEILVDRETRKWKDKREDSIRLKKNLYENSKQLEKAEQTEENGVTAKTPSRKQKLREQVRKNEDAYLWDTIDVEKQRRVTENVLRKGVESLEVVERQRLTHCQTALGRYQRKIDHLAPNLQQMFERHANNLDLAVQASATDYICTIQPSSSAVNSVLLTDFYAENFGEVMASDRRRLSLERISEILDGELKRIYGQGTAEIMATNTRQITLVEYIEYIFYKVNDALNSLDGGSARGYHRLSRFQHRLKDKAGLPMTVLSIPLAGEDRSLPPPSLMDASSTCKSDEDVEEYDKISDEGFYPASTNGSSSRQTTTMIDEPGMRSTLCRALYDFEPKHDDEILVRAGEVVMVEDTIGDDWLVGHVIGDKEREHVRGRFPRTYVAF